MLKGRNRLPRMGPELKGGGRFRVRGKDGARSGAG